MKRKLNIFKLLVLFASLLLATQLVALAHSAQVEELGGTYLRFYFSEDDPIAGVRIIVKDEDGQDLAVEKTDRDGIYSYEAYKDTADKILMNDGSGHQVTYQVPDEIPPITDKTPIEETEEEIETEEPETELDEEASEEEDEAIIQEESGQEVSKDEEKDTSSSFPYLGIALVVLIIIIIILVMRRRK